MSVNVSLEKFTTNEGIQQKVRTTSYERSNQKMTLKNMKGKKYHFMDYDVYEIFDVLLELNIIDLPETKQPCNNPRIN